MTGGLKVLRAGPAVTVQDLGRRGYMGLGLSRGGASDLLAMAEGAALLDQDVSLAALEMAAFGGEFEALADMRIALTGAPMVASAGDQPLVWNAVHFIQTGQRVKIGAASHGFYGYLHVGGGFATKPMLGSRSTHIVAGLGNAISAGTILPVGPDQNAGSGGVKLPVPDRFGGGMVRVTPSAQTDRFSKSELARFEATLFNRALHGNRQGVQLEFDGDPFAAEGQLSILSEIMVPGDIQMTGSGNPFVLLPECQTTGGYPRIGTVVPQDLPIVAQAPPGSKLRFKFVSIDDALETDLPISQICDDLKQRREALVRDPHEIRDLLSYQLISGVTAGSEPSEEGIG